MSKHYRNPKPTNYCVYRHDSHIARASVYMGKNLFSLQEVGSQLKLSLMYQVVPVADSWMVGPQTILSTHLLTHTKKGGLVGCEGGRVIRT